MRPTARPASPAPTRPPKRVSGGPSRASSPRRAGPRPRHAFCRWPPSASESSAVAASAPRASSRPFVRSNGKAVLAAQAAAG
eukprot:9971840-Alexandrium_andersonii.AAC.1